MVSLTHSLGRLERIRHRQVDVGGRLPPREQIQRLESSRLNPDLKLRREFVYHFARKRHISLPPVPVGDARQIVVVRVVSAECAVDPELIAQHTRRDRKLDPASARPDRPDAPGRRSDALNSGEIGIQALKNTRLKSSEALSRKRFACYRDDIRKRQIPIGGDAPRIFIVTNVRRSEKDG